MVLEQGVNRMAIQKVKGGWVILHHRKKGSIGKRIPATKKPVSYAKALSRPIMTWDELEKYVKRFSDNDDYEGVC